MSVCVCVHVYNCVCTIISNSETAIWGYYSLIGNLTQLTCFAVHAHIPQALANTWSS